MVPCDEFATPIHEIQGQLAIYTAVIGPVVALALATQRAAVYVS